MQMYYLSYPSTIVGNTLERIIVGFKLSFLTNSLCILPNSTNFVVCHAN